MKYLIVGIGGFVGANARYILTVWAAQRWGTGFPYGTFIINLTGSFILGLFGTLAVRLAWSDSIRLLVAVGFVGAYTTFSTFEYDSLQLIAQGRQYGAAAINIAGSVILGLLAAFFGVVTARVIISVSAWLGAALNRVG